MEKIDAQLNNLSMAEVLAGLHQSVMMKIGYRKMQPVLWVAFSLLLLNFLVIAWHINARLIDAEFIDMSQDFFEVFKFDLPFFSTMIIRFFEIISPALFISAILSLGGAIYTGRKIKYA